MNTPQELREYITKQTKLYQVTSATSIRIARAVETQHKIKSHRTIPKQYRPPKLPTVFATGNSGLQDSFKEKYSKHTHKHTHTCTARVAVLGLCVCVCVYHYYSFLPCILCLSLCVCVCASVPSITAMPLT